MELKGKTILLTGASSGIGYELAKLISKEQVNLVIAARRDEILNELSRVLADSGSNILPIKCDVTNRSDVKNAYNEIKSKFGSIDIAILNSGYSHRASVIDYNLDAAKEIFNVNVFGILNFIGEMLPDFIRRREGTIIGVSSLADCRGFPRSGFYSASKTAASFLLESLRIELKSYNIRVVTVKPGFVRTPMTDKNRFYMPFLMEPDKAAKIILRGIKKEKKIIQFPILTVLGAKLLRMIPDFLFEIIAVRVK